MDALKSMLFTDEKKKADDIKKKQQGYQTTVRLEYKRLKAEIASEEQRRNKAREKLIEARTAKNTEKMNYYWQLYRMYETRLQELVKKRISAKAQMLDMQRASTTASSVTIIKSSTAYMRSVHSGATIDNIDDSILDFQDTEAINADAGTSVSSPFSTLVSSTQDDTEDIMRQVDQMMITGSGSSGTGGGDNSVRIQTSLPGFPSVPSHEPAVMLPTYPIPISSSGRDNNLSKIVGLF